MVCSHSSFNLIGMYANEDPYGEEIEGDEDKNDGLNALVHILLGSVTVLCRTCNG